MKKIIIITRDLMVGGGGIGTYTKGIIKKFLDDGYYINLISPDNTFGNKVNFIKLNLVGKFFITKEFFVFLKVKKLIRKNKLENVTILSQNNFYGKGINNIFLFKHGEHFGQLEAIKKEKLNFKNLIGYVFHSLYKILDYLSIKYAKKVIFISKNTFEKAKIKYNSKFVNKFYHIPNFIEINELKEKNNINTNNNFLFVGRLEPLKGIDKLCKILEKNKNILKKEIGDFKLNIAGDGMLKEEIKKYDFVNYHGHLEKKELINLYQNSSIFLFPSLYENMPTVILEAMLYGKIILSRKVGDVEYMLGNDNYQIFENDREIIDKIKKIFKLSSEEKTKIILGNREKVKNYDINKIYLQIKKIIHEN